MTTSAIPISRMNSFVQDTSGGWWTESTAAQNALLNPRNDPLTARFQLARYNLMREALREREFAHVWREFGPMTQAIHEHRLDTLTELYRDWFADEMVYELDGAAENIAELCDKALQSQSTLIDIMKGTALHDAFEKRAAQLVEQSMMRTRDDFDDGVRLADITVALVDANSPEAIRYNSSLYSSQFERPLRILPKNMTPAQRQDAYVWATRIAPFQHDLHQSFEYMMNDIYVSSFVNNRLTGNSAKNDRLLLVDEGIPTPTMASFLGWYQIAGIAFRRLTKQETQIGSQIAGFEVDHILTYCAPTLPVTREHKQGGQIQTDDSHADHSLGVRSPGHRRDSHNRIVHGISRIRTVLLARDPAIESYVVADDLNPAHALASSGPEIHNAHRRMLPRFQDTFMSYVRGEGFNLDAFLPGLGFGQLSHLHGRLQNPWLASGESIPFYRLLRSDPADTGYRAIAKFGQCHFRFDSREDSDRWCADFERMATNHVHCTPAIMMQYYFEAALKIQLRISAPEKPIKTQSGKMQYSW